MAEMPLELEGVIGFSGASSATTEKLRLLLLLCARVLLTSHHLPSRAQAR